MQTFQRLVKKFNDELFVSIPVEVVDLLTPTKDHDSTKDVQDVDCFCCETHPKLLHMELPCCRKKLHSVCLGKHLENYASCLYCRTLLDCKDVLPKVIQAIQSMTSPPPKKYNGTSDKVTTTKSEQSGGIVKSPKPTKQEAATRRQNLCLPNLNLMLIQSHIESKGQS
eukprot:scaffold36263_cov40-Cyclotella_meneghiniana.AAC.2